MQSTYFNKTTSRCQRQTIKNLVSGKIVKKYCLQKNINKFVAPTLKKRKKNIKKFQLVIKEIQNFYIENSTIDPSKNKFVVDKKKTRFKKDI